MNIVVEREWREASDLRRSTLTLTGILAAAAVLRFWGLGAGVPYALEPGEHGLMNRVVHMMRTGDFDPYEFESPGFYLHLQLAVASLRFLTGAIAGAWQSLDHVRVADFIVWARAVSALLGTLTVLVVFHVAMRWGSRYALLAAGLVAVMPLHVRESHYVVTAIPLTFFVSLTFLLSLHAHEIERVRAFAWAGAAAGLAAATQYAGVLALLVPLVALSMTRGLSPRLSAVLGTLGGAAAAFLIAAPYTFLNLPGFLNGAARVAAICWGDDGARSGWLYYLDELRQNLHWPALLLMIAGTTLGIVRSMRGPGRVRWTMIVVVPLVYLWFLASLAVVHSRLLLPIVPLVCVLTAVAVVSGVSLLRRFDIPRTIRTALIFGLTLAALLPPAFEAVRFNRASGKQTTTALAYEWILSNVPPGSRLVVEGGILRLPETYHVQHVAVPAGHNHEHLGQIDYLVVSSALDAEASGTRPAAPKEYVSLPDGSREVARFTPDRDHPGPELRIYSLK